jgi:tetratricopeptide (TPR) repeat protein
VGAPSDIDRLIELGLNRYGAGDLEGALLMWEEALAIDPDNARASSYADYVRLHYEMLAGGEPEIAPADEAPFGIEEEPEYQIEIEPGELDPSTLREAQPPVAADALDLGWFDEEATHDVSSTVEPAAAPEEPEIELTLEAEEPALPPAAPEAREGDIEPLPEVSFEDATREYHGNPTKPALPVGDLAPAVPITHTEFESEAGTGGDFSEAGTSEFKQEYTGGFQPEGTPIGFGNQETEIRKRNFGFVQPTASTSTAAPTPVRDKPSSPLTIGSAPTIDTLQLGELTQERLSAPEGTSPGEKTLERRPSFEHALDEPDERDLLEGLPVPNRPAKPQPADVEPEATPLVGSKGITKELPDSKRPPARRDSADLSQAEVMMNAAATRDFSPKIDIAAPTRELGIRPPSKRPPTLENPDDDDMPTKQSDARAIRDTAREQGRAQPRAASEPTHHDLLPLDPVDARTAQILDEIDAEAPAAESASDQTRRRITTLLERAVAWNQAGDPEKAVCAVDLALDEDPNSAVAQKLITRHRDAIMNVMQSYLGDLERQPQLAKSLQDLQNAPISPRAAFLVSRIDGTLTLDELLDVSGMPRLEALRHLCQLHLRGVLR